MSWELTNLQEVTSKIGDGLHGTPKYDKNGEYYFINGNNLRQGRVEIKEDTKKIDFQQYQKIKKDLNNQTIFVAINGTLGNIGIYNGEKIALGKSACYLNINQNVEKLFIRYVLEDGTFQSYAQRFATGATIKNLGLKAIRNYEFLLPPLKTQKRIADILSAYDDLIENNLKRIKLLAQAAQNIYEEWFVNLRFPGHENTPINQETRLPEGWEVCTINDVCIKVASGGTPSRRNKSYWDNSKYPWVTTKELRDGFILDVKESVSEEGLKKSSAKLFPKGTILMAIYASPTLGRLGILSREACCNQAAVGFICDNTKISNQFLYCTLYSERSNLNSIAIGAAQQNINVGKVKAHEIILPPFYFVERFTSITSANYEMRLNLVIENQKLKAARDILLPRLMNRTIEV